MAIYDDLNQLSTEALLERYVSQYAQTPETVREGARAILNARYQAGVAGAIEKANTSMEASSRSNGRLARTAIVVSSIASVASLISAVPTIMQIFGWGHR